ncbi:MAG: hypothetical protein ACFFD4_38105, partial [Candidatus Odinarchaeota archaeon]
MSATTSNETEKQIRRSKNTRNAGIDRVKEYFVMYPAKKVTFRELIDSGISKRYINNICNNLVQEGFLLIDKGKRPYSIMLRTDQDKEKCPISINDYHIILDEYFHKKIVDRAILLAETVGIKSVWSNKTLAMIMMGIELFLEEQLEYIDSKTISEIKRRYGQIVTRRMINKHRKNVRAAF